MTEVVNYLQQRGDIKQAILFGSLATGREGADSDIDLAIEKDHRLIADEIVELIEQLALITGRAVDLIDWRANPRSDYQQREATARYRYRFC